MWGYRACVYRHAIVRLGVAVLGLLFLGLGRIRVEVGHLKRSGRGVEDVQEDGERSISICRARLPTREWQLGASVRAAEARMGLWEGAVRLGGATARHYRPGVPTACDESVRIAEGHRAGKGRVRMQRRRGVRGMLLGQGMERRRLQNGAKVSRGVRKLASAEGARARGGSLLPRVGAHQTSSADVWQTKKTLLNLQRIRQRSPDYYEIISGVDYPGWQIALALTRVGASTLAWRRYGNQRGQETRGFRDYPLTLLQVSVAAWVAGPV